MNDSAAPFAGPADLVLKNARIATLSEAEPFVSALAVRGGVVAAAGGEAEVRPFIGPRTTLIDGGGRTVIPGLNDSHTHFIRTGLNYALEVRWDGVPTLAEALSMLAEQARRTPAPNWVQVLGGWSAYQFAERRLPTLAEINAACGDTPAYVLHLYDRCFLNRAALRALGVDRNAQDPFGGSFERDGRGNPTGLIVSTTSLAAVVFLQGMIPKLSIEDQGISTRRFMRELNRLGVTSLIDAGGAGQSYPDDYRVIQQLADGGLLSVRIAYTLFCQHRGSELDDYLEWAGKVAPGDGTDFLRMSGGGEYLVWSAADPANFAKEYLPQPQIMESELAGVLRLIAGKGWPFRLHATYDESVQRILSVIEAVDREVPLDRIRWTIDHAETISPRSLERVAALGGAISIQNRMSLDGEAFVARLGAAAAADAPPIARIRGMGIPLSCGTDGTRCTSYNPWVGLHWLVTGKTAGGLRHQGEHNLVDRMEALRLYSEAGAWFTGEEEKKGRLAPGMLADLAILSADYFSISDDMIPELESLLTMAGGRVVHASGPFAEHAPPDLPVSPDWAATGRWNGYYSAKRRSRAAGEGVGRHQGHQSVVAPNGFLWELGCGCAWG